MNDQPMYPELKAAGKEIALAVVVTFACFGLWVLIARGISHCIAWLQAIN